MTVKFDRFIAELRDLCLQHNVMICPSMYDNVEVWDIGGYDVDPTGVNDIVDCTEEVPNEL